MQQPAERKLFLWMFAALALACLAWYALNLGKPMRNDDVLWSYGGLAILARGLPQLVYGPQPLIHWGLWHPPLFLYENALIFRLLGWSEPAARLSGMLGMLGAAALGCLLLSRQAAGRAGVFLFGLALGIPFMQGGLIPDIDGALLTPLLAGLACCQAEGIRDPPRFPLGKASLLWALLLMSKWTTPPFVGLVWFTWLGFNLGWKQALRQAGLSMALGSALFALGFLAWCAWAQVSPFYPLEFSFIEKAGGALKSAGLGTRLASLLHGLGALGPGLPLAALGAWLESRRSPEGRLAGFFLLQAAVLLLAYSLLFPGLGWHVLTWKYLSPAVVFLALALALGWRECGVAPARMAGLLALSAIAYFALVPLHRHHQDKLELFYFFLAAAWLWKGGLPGACAPRVAGVGLAWLQAMGFALLMASTPADCSPAFPTGEIGFAEMIRAKPREALGRVLLARKDVTFYLSPEKGLPIDPHFGRPAKGMFLPLEKRPLALKFSRAWPYPVSDWGFYPSFEAAFVDDEAGLLALLKGPVEAVVDSDYDSFLKSPAVKAAALERFPRRLKFGHYSLYSRP